METPTDTPTEGTTEETTVEVRTLTLLAIMTLILIIGENPLLEYLLTLRTTLFVEEPNRQYPARTGYE